MEGDLKHFLYLVLLINVITTILTLRNFSGVLLIIEIVAAAFVLTASFYIVYGVEKRRKTALHAAMVFFALIILNALALYLMTRQFYFQLIALLNLAGLYISVMMIPEEKSEPSPKRGTTKKEELKKELKGLETKEPEVIIEEIRMEKKARRMPGLKKQEIIASKKSSIYHDKKCARAKAIPKKNRIRFKSRFEAENSGFTPHECVE